MPFPSPITTPGRKRLENFQALSYDEMCRYAEQPDTWILLSIQTKYQLEMSIIIVGNGNRNIIEICSMSWTSLQK